ncbi:GDP-mannose 4,6 dehydratase [Subtercola boreus]|uniref:GDP-mannose 4,6-dehydratase n=1 Tax=Subtercola boreus TaxID=120213 RepID=A0A3E0VG70_9MICO|nr:GDP-mannose 4,6-dehydratase [Subtercola boreus]RFA08438.1 GDP-mannose 4,6 dehydratase [Subtercola boreus]TQL54646.1 GDPmannose 4,6-dehydratase [Subtercola boreus]
MPVALVTGISGQDGSYLAESLLADGYEVHGLVRNNTEENLRALGSPAGLTLHTVDLQAPDALESVVRAVRPDELYSLAAVSSVAASWNDPVMTGAVNGQVVVRLLDAAFRLQEEHGHPVRVLHASSAEIFGQAEQTPQVETTAIRPSSPYGASKAYAHLSVGVFRGRGLHASNTVLYNHESPRRPETFVTRKITAGVARISRGLQDGLELGNLDARRDWGWAPDYVRAMRLAVAAPEAGDFIVATGVSHTISDFLSAAFGHVGITDWEHFVTVNPAFVRPVDPAEQLGDSSKARRELGWEPTVDFEALVARMVEHDLGLLAR